MGSKIEEIKYPYRGDIYKEQYGYHETGYFFVLSNSFSNIRHVGEFRDTFSQAKEDLMVIYKGLRMGSTLN